MNVDSFGSSTEVTKIKIVHAFEHGEEEIHINESPEEHSRHEDKSHTHEVVLVSSVVYVMTKNTTFKILSIPTDYYPVSFEVLPPKSLHLDSIFRPPIV